MKTDFRHYIREVKGKTRKDVRRCLRATVWVAAIAATYVIILSRFFYSLCPSVLITGYPCPACGMTRAVTLVLTGHFAEAARLQPFVYVLGIFAVVFFVYRYLLLKDSMEWIKWSMAVIIACMILFYIYRMIRYFPNIPPMTYYKYNLLYYLKGLFGTIVF